MPAPNENTPANDVVRFGPFEADFHTGELRKSGVKLKLQELPFRLLAALLERPGVLVTREELQAKLWPGGTFVDFERGIGTALNKVRDALGDSAATPRFIETVPRKGYRFVAEVQRGRKPANDLASSPDPATRSRVPPKRWILALIAVVVAIVLASGWTYSRFRRSPRALTDQDVLVLADFANTTGDAAFDGALRQALAFDLEESPFLKVMDDEEMNQTLRLMDRPPGQPITNDVAHEFVYGKARRPRSAARLPPWAKPMPSRSRQSIVRVARRWLVRKSRPKTRST